MPGRKPGVRKHPGKPVPESVKRRPRAPGKKLSEKELLFVDEFIRTRSLTEAAMAVWPTLKPRDASVYGCVKAKIPEIAAAILAAKEAVAAEAKIESAEVLREIARIAFFDTRSLFDKSGNLLRPHQWPEAVAHCVQSIKFQPQGGLEIKVWDKGRALEQLSKHLGLFEKDNQQQAASVIAAALALVDGGTSSLLPSPDAE